MPYASVDQLKEVIPARDLELLTDFEHSGEPSDTRLQRALVDATAEINGYITKVVKRPLADLQTRRGSEGRFYAELNWGHAISRHLSKASLYQVAHSVRSIPTAELLDGRRITH